MSKRPWTSISGRLLRDRYTWTWIAGIFVVILVISGIGKHIVDSYSGLLQADRMVRMTAALSGAEARSLPVTLISIDDETRGKWGNPVITPHAALAQLIRLARESGASSILVDIDLSSETPGQMADPALYNEIAHFPENAPLLMLVRNIRFRSEEGADGRRFVADSVRPTPYDRMVADTGKAVWVNAVTKFEGDRVARRIQLWQSVCDGAGGTAYGSPALYIAALANGDPRRAASIPAFLASRVAAECAGAPETAHDWPARSNPSVAVQYTIGPGTGSVSASTVEVQGRDVPVYRNVAGWTLLDEKAGRFETTGVIDASPFAGRTVLIGVTHADSRDVNTTPLGSQSGVLILANSVASARALADMPELSPLTESIIVAVLFAVFAYIGTRLQLVLVTLLVGILSVVALMILSRLFGFDAAMRIVSLSVLLVALHRIADAIAGIAYDWKRGLGWRALLKPKPDFHKP